MVFGGTNGDSQFLTMDIDSLDNIIVGGKTNDGTLAKAYGTYNSWEPILIFI